GQPTAAPLQPKPVTTYSTPSASAPTKSPPPRRVKPRRPHIEPALNRFCPTPALAPITRAPGTGKTIALTFDDGPSPYTPQILAVLAKFGVHATFFETGLHDTAYPQYARAVEAAGNVIGDHTYDHPKNWGLRRYFPVSAQRAEVARTSALQAGLIGHAPCVMRPPGGAWDLTSLRLVRSLGMSMVLWTTDAEDWRQPPVLSKAFQQRLIRNAEDGIDLRHPILLMHDGKASHEPDCGPRRCAPGQVGSFRGNTVAALPTIIEFYLAHGYRFVTFAAFSR
ncbi:MAG: polysaccharide deacetylase family protein, partial [Marmoricola sp.]